MAARVTAAVETLAVLHGDAGHRRKRLGLAQHAIGDVGLKADALPLAGAERSALVEDRVRDPEPAEPVCQTGATRLSDVRFSQAQPCACLRGKIGNRTRMPQEVRRLQVDEVGDRQERGVEALARQQHGERLTPRPTSTGWEIHGAPSGPTLCEACDPSSWRAGW